MHVYACMYMYICICICIYMPVYASRPYGLGWILQYIMDGGAE